jgi:hypothetical protein
MKAATACFRAAVSVHVVLLFAQPVLIGLFLSGGDRDKLRAHEMGGNAVGASGILLVVASIVVWRKAHWPARAVPWSIGLVVAEVVQLTMGYDRHLGVHVPLGVLLTVTACFVHAWAYRPQPVRSPERRPRTTRATSG